MSCFLSTSTLFLILNVSSNVSNIIFFHINVFRIFNVLPHFSKVPSFFFNVIPQTKGGRTEVGFLLIFYRFVLVFQYCSSPAQVPQPRYLLHCMDGIAQIALHGLHCIDGIDCIAQMALHRWHCIDCIAQIAMHRLHGLHSIDCTSQIAQHRLPSRVCPAQILQHRLHSIDCITQVALHRFHCIECITQIAQIASIALHIWHSIGCIAIACVPGMLVGTWVPRLPKGT